MQANCEAHTHVCCHDIIWTERTTDPSTQMAFQQLCGAVHKRLIMLHICWLSLKTDQISAWVSCCMRQYVDICIAKGCYSGQSLYQLAARCVV